MRKGIAFLAATFVLVAGCKDSSMAPVAGDQNVLVKMTASPGHSADPIRLGKESSSMGTLAAIDSLTVDTALIVLKDLSFIPAIDTAQTRDSLRCSDDDDAEEHEGEMMFPRIHFKGPFLVQLLSGQPTQITLDTIPAGVYNGIKFVIHKLRMRDVMRNPSFPDSLEGFSIMIKGSLKYAGLPRSSFVYKTDIDEEFKVKGNFMVSPGDRLVPYVLNFDIASWFIGPAGRILDPASFPDRWIIRQTIKAALKGRVHGGRDFNDDGDPD
jgi:hypothetical protein